MWKSALGDLLVGGEGPSLLDLVPGVPTRTDSQITETTLSRSPPWFRPGPRVRHDRTLRRPGTCEDLDQVEVGNLYSGNPPTGLTTTEREETRPVPRHTPAPIHSRHRTGRDTRSNTNVPRVNGPEFPTLSYESPCYLI